MPTNFFTNSEDNSLIKKFEVWGFILFFFLAFHLNSFSQYAVAYTTVANGKASGSHKSELTTQVLCGYPVKVLQKTATWTKVMTIDNYQCWMQNNQLVFLSKERMKNYLEHEKVIFTSINGYLYAAATYDAAIASDAVAGCLYEFEKIEGNFVQVKTPDGRLLYANMGDVAILSAWLQKIEINAEKYVKIARQFMGVAYLWGGTSSKFLDCSGLVQLSFLLCGVVVPRDADKQIIVGHEIAVKSDFSNLQAGDLIFFADSNTRAITHIAISLGGSRFLHESGSVHESDFSASKPDYSPYYTPKIFKVTRLFDKPVSTNLQQKLLSILGD